MRASGRSPIAPATETKNTVKAKKGKKKERKRCICTNFFALLAQNPKLQTLNPKAETLNP